MLDSPIVDVAMGIAFYVTLSLVCSSIQEIIASLLGLRSRNLKNGRSLRTKGGRWTVQPLRVFNRTPCGECPRIRRSSRAGRVRRRCTMETRAPRSMCSDDVYSCSKPWSLNLSVLLFSLTVRTT